MKNPLTASAKSVKANSSAASSFETIFAA